MSLERLDKTPQVERLTPQELAEEIARHAEETVGEQYADGYIGWIVKDLKAGNIERAKNTCFNQSDKFGIGKEEIKKLLIKHLFEEGEELPWVVMNK